MVEAIPSRTEKLRRRFRAGIAAIDALENRLFFTAYYVNSAASSGMGSSASPWNALSQVSAYTGFHSGDVVNLTGTFDNQILTLGSAATGITITSSATAPAKIVEAASYAFTYAIQINAAGVTLSNLTLTGPGITASSNSYYGIWFDNTGSTQLTGATVTNINESGFVFAGLQIQGGTYGFSNVTASNSNFSNNQVSGIVAQGSSPTYTHLNLTISYCTTSNNAGYAIYYNAHHSGATENSDNGGILLSSVNGALVNHCTAIGNCYDSSGAVGIWADDCNAVIFQNSESGDNGTTVAGADGDGFDFDHGVNDSIMQYDYSHGNAGAGYFICTFDGVVTDTSDTIRYCISDDDAQLGGAAITIYGYSMNLIPHPVLGANIYNNTVLVGGAAAAAVGITGITPVAAGYCTANFFDNLFYSSTGFAVINIPFFTPLSSNVVFQGNDSWSAAPGNFSIAWGTVSYTSLAAWSAATGEETLGTVTTGLNSDPQLVNETPGDLPISSISNLQLSTNSPLRGVGMDLTASPFTNTPPYTNYAPYNPAGTAWNGSGGRDYFGNAVAHGGSHDIGANQVSALILTGLAGGDTFSLEAGTSPADTLNVNRSHYSLLGIDSVVINGSTGNESVSFDFANGPLTNGAGTFAEVTFNAGTATNTLITTNTGAGGSMPIYFAPGSSTLNYLNASYGTITVPPGTQSGINIATFSNITIGAGAEVAIANSNQTNRTLVVITSSLTLAGTSGDWTGTLDLAGNDMDVKSGNLAILSDQIRQAWTDNWLPGGGIISSAAALNTAHLTTLGILLNNVFSDQATSPIYSKFDTAMALSTDVLIKYTYAGDANLDGVVNGSDYALIDNGLLGHLTGWYNGDFNYDGVIDATDYALIDNSFNTEGAGITAHVEGGISLTKHRDQTPKRD